MKPFADAGFLLTLILETHGSPAAWQIAKKMEDPLYLSWMLLFHTENRLRREIESTRSTREEKAKAAGALRRLHWYLDQQVFQLVSIDYDVAFKLAYEWQKNSNSGTTQGMLLLWPALAATVSATHFLSFDPRTRELASSSGLRLLPVSL